jgi:FkbM family methyltransferase
MRLAAPSYRVLFFLSVALAVASFLSSVVYTRRMDAAAKRANEECHELNPLAISAFHYRDKEFNFTVDNYGFVYRGTTGTIMDDTILTSGAWEKEMLFFMEDYVRAADLKGTAFLDVGANTGVHSLFMATRVKQVHSVEPFPPVLKRLHENIRLNKFANILVHEVGYGDREAVLPFHAPDERNHGNGTFRGDESKATTHLRIVPADDHLRGVPTPPLGLVKIDIEGFEESALKGMRQTLDKHRPLVIVEVSTTLHNGTISSHDQLKALFPANYELFVFVPQPRARHNGHYELAEFAPRAEKFFATQKHENFVAVPAEQLPKMPRKNLPR